MNILIYGEDTYRSRQHLNKMIASFKEKRDPQGLNVAVLDGKKMDSSDLWNELGVMPFLAEKRLLVLHGFLEHGAKELQEALHEKLTAGAYVDTTVIIFHESETSPNPSLGRRGNKKNPLFDFLKNQPYSSAFPLLQEFEREAWIKNEVRTRGGSITTGAARMIAANVTETWQLAQVTQQACALAGTEEIQRPHVEPFIEPSINDNIFAFTDALSAGNTTVALELLHDQRRADANEFYLLTMITRQFRILLELQDLNPREEQTTAKELGLHPFVLKKSLPLAKRYAKNQLERIYHNLLSIETALKTTAVPADTLIDRLVMTATT
ncbi:DNA polymerase III subunit delta [Candidatus Uhrbacteria bacterium RIFCSPLOWO2_02_FULL_51_9]|uniref:DNA polymerase III subunit delta n=1 Tax=Candidatus Uhrbacteria bacterium RIFCSPLOWO2_02_FULL_51_9 TaxID=1802410 RepID=A0A1F7VFX7_9BACT|nr:MAG: DNA polymerase III subunit delta [Candidatus Uhrbacteria bacterium RIFCSPLOWO2_02_FULL_51_9]